MNMQQYHTKLSVSVDGKIVVTKVPFSPGEEVDVYIFSKGENVPGKEHYPLQGTPILYLDPFLPVVEDEWEADM